MRCTFSFRPRIVDSALRMFVLNVRSWPSARARDRFRSEFFVLSFSYIMQKPMVSEEPSQLRMSTYNLDGLLRLVGSQHSNSGGQVLSVLCFSLWIRRQLMLVCFHRVTRTSLLTTRSLTRLMILAIVPSVPPGPSSGRAKSIGFPFFRRPLARRRLLI